MKQPAPRSKPRPQSQPDPLLLLLKDILENTHQILDLLDPPKPKEEEQEEEDPYEELLQAMTKLAHGQAQIKTVIVDMSRQMGKMQLDMQKIRKGSV